MNAIRLPSIDPTTFCRLCFSEINLLIVIKPGHPDQLANQKLLQLIRTHLRLELEESKDFPSAVCEVCYGLLREFDFLYKNAHSNSETLRLLIESESQFQSKRPKLKGNTTVNTIVEVYVNDEIKNKHDPYEANIPADSDPRSGQLILEDVPYIDASNQEQQVHVFHDDGELQQVVMKGESYFVASSANDVNKPVNGAVNKPFAPTLSSFLQKPTAAQNDRGSSKLLPLPQRSYKVLVKNTVFPISRKDPIKTAKKKPEPVTVGETSDTSLGKQLFRCNRCSNLFVEISNYYCHSCPQDKKKSVLPVSAQVEKMAPYQCQLCKVGYRRELFLHKHQYEAHGICSDNFGITCKICNIQFSQKQDYRLHELAIHPD